MRSAWGDEERNGVMGGISWLCGEADGAWEEGDAADCAFVLVYGDSETVSSVQ